jgi:hypothetical protein
VAFEKKIDLANLDWVRGEEEPLETFSRTLISRTTWDDVALDDRVSYEASLRGAGLSEQSILEAILVLDDATAEISEARERLKPYRGIHFAASPPDYIAAQSFYRTKRESAQRKLRNWWKKSVKVVGSEPRTVTIPLFVLGTPSVPGCKAEWTNEISSGLSMGWPLHIAGSGFGSDSGYTYVESASFEASSGEYKVIYCEADLLIEHIEIKQKGGQSLRQSRIDLTRMNHSRPSLGLLLLAPEAVPARGAHARRFPLAGDPSGSSATYTHKYSQDKTKSVSVGIDVHGVQLGLTAKSDFGSSVEIRYTLKTGSDYELFHAADCDGLLFGTTPASP